MYYGSEPTCVRPQVSWTRTSPPRDDVGATALAPLLYIGQISLGIHHQNSVTRWSTRVSLSQNVEGYVTKSAHCRRAGSTLPHCEA